MHASTLIPHRNGWSRLLGGPGSIRWRAEQRARGLGALSLGLGLAELLAPRPVARLVGLRDDRATTTILRILGIREIASGIGLLARPSSGPLWSRVVGDAVDAALLTRALVSGRSRPHLGRALAATAAVLGVAALDGLTAARLSPRRAIRKWGLPVHVLRTITINRPAEEIYRFWRNFENLPRFMDHLESVRVTNGRSRWRAKAPAGTSIEWEAELLQDEPNQSIAWRSLEGTSVPHRGVVRFSPAPGNRGTEVLVELKYDPPGGLAAAALAKLFGEEPSQQIADDLRRLKQVLETGEVIHSDASIHSGRHPARPAGGRRGTSAALVSGSQNRTLGGRRVPE